MCDVGLMMIKPEVPLDSRRQLFPLIKYYLSKFNMHVLDNVLVEGDISKSIVFDVVYQELLKNATSKLERGLIGSYDFLKLHSEYTERDLYDLWVSPNNIPNYLVRDCYYLELCGLKILSPFFPHQRSMFISSTNPAHIFIVRKSIEYSWQILKERFQGSPKQDGSFNVGIRSYMSEYGWYTPTLNGLHLSASNEEAAREVAEMVRLLAKLNGKKYV
ncbi:hypothetical protein [Providencia sp. PROV255]|uniref:hypothetical protein n=1 Tax=Providencia sp. PROV255 TaxID=2949943 RepID=UPI00234A4EB0|nr:hypothetical protein [Providencia sp. PROV255]